MLKASRNYKAGLQDWLKKSRKNQIEYLKASVEENSDMPDAILIALRDIAEVRGFEKLAKEAGLSQKALYKILSSSKTAKPRFETVSQVLQAIGVRLTVEPIETRKKVG